MGIFFTRRLLFILIIIISIMVVFHLFYTKTSLQKKYQLQSQPPSTSESQRKLKSKPHKQVKVQSAEVELLLKSLFHSSTTLIQLQYSWNKLMNIWRTVLEKFLHDACDLCHSNNRQCLKSVDIHRYINYINKSFYPYDVKKRPEGIGLYHKFDLTIMRSLNNSILSTDVTPCDYFHMFQLMINVQIVLHEKNIAYFVTKGTFIGSLRHHDVIPWDTDIDLFIPYSSVLEFTNSFKRINIFTDRNIIGIPVENNDTYK